MCVFQPENILMADQKSDHIRICDFGNALKVKPNEELYCKYGTPEFIAPEIVNSHPSLNLQIFGKRPSIHLPF